VIAPPRTGKETTNKNEVTNKDQTYKGNRCSDNPGALMLNAVVIKLIEPKIEAAPDK